MKKSQIITGIVGSLIILIALYMYMGVDMEDPLVPTESKQATTTDTTIVATSSVVIEAETDDSEAKAEPSLRALDVKPWEWVNATYADGRTVAPTTEGDFTMTFGAGGGVSFKTDCNSMSSSYEAYTGGLTFAPIASTKMYCEDSKETEFAALITETKTYRFTEKGELILQTEAGDSIIFK